MKPISQEIIMNKIPSSFVLNIIFKDWKKFMFIDLPTTGSSSENKAKNIEAVRPKRP
jgi:hypothetical protein